MPNYLKIIIFLFCAMGQQLAFGEEEKDLIARGEHRIEVQNFGYKRPEVPISIMQANYYNEHHPEYVIRIEDLNQTLNRQINADEQREYNAWFEAEFNRRLADYHEAYHADDESDEESPSEEEEASVP